MNCPLLNWYQLVLTVSYGVDIFEIFIPSIGLMTPAEIDFLQNFRDYQRFTTVVNYTVTTNTPI